MARPSGTGTSGPTGTGPAPTAHAAGSETPSILDSRLSDERSAEELALIRTGYEAADGRPVTLRANTLKTNVDEVTGSLDAAGIAFERVPWYRDALVLRGVRERAIWDLPLYREGKVYLQSLSSMLPPLVLGPRSGADILDMCAAPGGKTCQMAALTRGTAHITACEMNGARADKLEHNLAMQGAGGVSVMRTDARRLDTFFSFDQILVDAPCTGSGTLRAGDARGAARITEKLLSRTTRSQAALLDRALTVLKRGGTLVYSTCSILVEENEVQIERALGRHRDCELVPLEQIGGIDPTDPPFRTLSTRMEGTLTICPDELFEGFFIARLRKK